MHIENQREIENMYSKRAVKKKLIQEISECPELHASALECVNLIQDYVSQSYYESKNQRIAEFVERKTDLLELVYDIFYVVVPKRVPELYTSVVGEVASVIGMTDKGDGAKMAGELLAVLCEADVWDIIKEDKFASLYIVSNYDLSEELRRYMMQAQYLPPMICPPNKVRSNYDSGYLTKRESMILGKGNFHTGEICLDSINKFNQVPLTLNVELLTTLSETPKRDFKDGKQREQWMKFVNDSYRVYKELIQQGNEFYLTHRVDKRGRTYAQGYHVSTQGNSFRKAMIQFAEPELVEGVCTNTTA